MASQRHVPASTYRIQLHRGFTFADVQAVLGYLEALGISDVYFSPITTAVSGSLHGYDVIDPTRLNPELGGESAYRAMSEEARRLGLGQVIDIVPNHMGIASDANQWWHDVLRRGRESRYARVFDINWESASPSMRGRIMLPILGDALPAVIERGEITLEVQDDGEVVARYYEHVLPLDPATLEHQLATYPSRDGAGPEDRRALVERINAQLTEAATIEWMRGLLDAQHYRLEFWRAAKPRVNYRRFFVVDELIGVRTEDPVVFAATHRLALRLVAEGSVQGLRVDHPDGLADPESYLRRLRAAATAQHDGGDDQPAPLYVVIEKILASDEALPEQWSTDGTTGYDFMNDLNGIFVATEHEAQFSTIHMDFTGRAQRYSDIAFRARMEIIEGPLSGQFIPIAQELYAVVERDVEEARFVEALRVLICCLPVYRTYHTARGSDPAAPAVIATALAEAQRHSPDTEALEEAAALLSSAPAGAVVEPLLRLQQLMPAVQAKGLEDTAFYRYSRLLSLNEVGGEPDRFGIELDRFHEHNRDRHEHWPATMLATATHDHKRGEDVRARLNVLSELPDEWDAALDRWSALTVDLRRRIGADGPDRHDQYVIYQTLLGAWPPDELDAEERAVLLDRFQTYMLKASREAGERTNWQIPDEQYEAGVRAFLAAILEGDESEAFLADFLPLQRRIAALGAINSLAQVLLRVGSPGTPDTYQGTELWDLSLVDPDNRRVVDFGARIHALEGLRPALDDAPGGELARSALAAELLADWPSGLVKQYVLARALHRRRALHPFFVEADYVPLTARGARARHVIAFARATAEHTAVVVAPRFPARLLSQGEGAGLWAPEWGDTELALPARLGAPAYRDAFTGATFEVTNDESGARLPLADVLGVFPVALLEPA